MIALLKKDATQADISRLVSSLEEKHVHCDVSASNEGTVLTISGNTNSITPLQLETEPIVSKVICLSSPQYKALRTSKSQDTVVDCGFGCKIGGGNFQLIAGPCAVEEDNLFAIAQQVRASGASILRGGAFKPRTSPYSFQGLGKRGLYLLSQVREDLNMPVVTEIMDVRDIDMFLTYNIDILQVGARNCQNFTLLKELGKINKPILLKRGMSVTLEELLQAAEYILTQGNNQVILCERGIRGFGSHARNTFDVNAIPALKELTHLPIIADPSHATGKASLVDAISCAACAAGADGLEIEVHTDPVHAASDGQQSLSPDMFEQTAQKIFAIHSVVAPHIDKA